MSQSLKRKYEDTPSSNGTHRTPKRKVKSCDACRRLKTRCEVQPGAGSCHRCGVLKLECSLDHGESQLGPINTEAQSAPVNLEEQSRETGERLKVLEASLARVEALLEKQSKVLEHVTNLHLQNHMGPDSRKEILSPLDATSPKSHRSIPSFADKNSRTAPMSLIRDMKQHILGVERALENWNGLEDPIAQGILEDNQARTFLAGFSQLSSRWLFMRGSPESIRRTSPLLFTTCLLAGLHIDPRLHDSTTHHRLYQHFSHLIGRALLRTPLSIESVQSIFMASMWNLVPNKDIGYIDSWLSSGMAGMHGMLAMNFEKLLQPNETGIVSLRAREWLRTWNLICLCHLQFSIGTGRPPIISAQYRDQCQNILSLPGCDPHDRLVVEGVTLYSRVSEYLSSDVVQTDSLKWEQIEDWKAGCSDVYNEDLFKPLTFAYSCSYLVLARRTIKHLADSVPSSPHLQSSQPQQAQALSASSFIQLSIEHAHTILDVFNQMSNRTFFVRPAYENLLCSYAMVTLSEFAGYLVDPNATLALMKTTTEHIQRGSKAEPVSRWAYDVLKKFVHDEQHRSVPASDNRAAADAIGRMDTSTVDGFAMGMSNVDLNGIMWGDHALATGEFPPSLAEMFLM